MQQSSESIGAIAAALAKAQLELTNPEKSLSATIVSPFPREEARTFRYAPLSSGLEIVRKCLGKHEIAAIQTTTIDKDTGLIRLTTTLAHSSGEWMASEWPVCPVSETSAPHRLGAALTYARRHSLFALVGITGDDDRDAPDLGSGTSETSGTISHMRNGESGIDGIASDVPPHRSASTRKSPRQSESPRFAQRGPMLSADQSATTRDRLLTELDGVSGADELAGWAKQTIPVKNDLLLSDAAIIEAAFTAKAVDLPSEVPPPPVPHHESPDRGRMLEEPGSSQKSPPRSSPQRIDKSVLAFPEPRRIRDKGHLKFVATQPCLICGRTPSDAHHIRFAQLRALGRKVSDEFTVPLCRGHHRQLHQTGDEAAFWSRLNLEPLKIASELWKQTRSPEVMPAAHDAATT